MIAILEGVAARWFSWAVAASWQLALLVVVVALIAWAARRASPRLRYVLWLLILIKMFLPPSLAMPGSIGSWGLSPLWNTIKPITQSTLSSSAAVIETESTPPAAMETAPPAPPPTFDKKRLTNILFIIWCAGALAFYLLVFKRYQKLRRSLNQMPLVDEGPLRVRLEKIALELGETRLPDLYLSEQASSPFLFGLRQPSIILPQQVVERLSPADIDSVMRHELNHWHWRDPWVGWLQVLAQGLFWFHPLVWFANTRLRHERECVCDEAVLRAGKCEPSSYGEALLAVLSAARGRSSVQGSLVGIFEPGANIQSRLEEIMSYEPGKRRFGVLSYLALAVFAVVLLPMALPQASAQPEQPLVKQPGSEKPSGPAEKVRRWPWIVKTVPAVGAKDVDPDLREITVTFDRDMQAGMSWTGDKKFYFPPIRSGEKAQWRDKRTCVLPVQLKQGQYYRVGINSTDFRNFKSKQNEPAPCAVIYFTTTGATQGVLNRLRVPEVVELTPGNGAADVEPTKTTLCATFDMPMSGGMSWTGGGETFPTITAGKKIRWTRSNTACVMPVELLPEHQYYLGINSYSHINFQSKYGVPAVPIEYSFATAAK